MPILRTASLATAALTLLSLTGDVKGEWREERDDGAGALPGFSHNVAPHISLWRDAGQGSDRAHASVEVGGRSPLLPS